MKEIDFYPEICTKFKSYLESYFPNGTEISFAYNKSLPQLVDDIEKELGQKSRLSKKYIPKLKLDILFGIRFENADDIKFILIEVKHLTQLGLSEYSQLVGYMQVAKEIKFGVLFIVLMPKSTSPLSNDFYEIIRTNNLLMEWKVLLDKNMDERDFKTGISYYVPNNGIEWIDTRELNGISSFEEFAKLVVE
jgi:hypothetical protein